MIEACPKFIFIKKCLEKPFIKYHYGPQQKNYISPTDRKKSIYTSYEVSTWIIVEQKEKNRKRKYI
jgi:hypothetical protein